MLYSSQTIAATEVKLHSREFGQDINKSTGRKNFSDPNS